MHSAGPVMVTAKFFELTLMSRVPFKITDVDALQWLWCIPATTVAHAPVPHAMVSPTPRSNTRISNAFGMVFDAAANSTFTPLGK